MKTIQIIFGKMDRKIFDEIYNYFKLHNAACINAIRALVIL